MNMIEKTKNLGIGTHTFKGIMRDGFEILIVFNMIFIIIYNDIMVIT